jgi:hypothetical protein
LDEVLVGRTGRVWRSGNGDGSVGLDGEGLTR